MSRLISIFYFGLLAISPVFAGDRAFHPNTVENIAADAWDVFDKFDNLAYLPTSVDQPARIILGDTHGFLHVYEQKDGAFEEVWTSGVWREP